MTDSLTSFALVATGLRAPSILSPSLKPDGEAGQAGVEPAITHGARYPYLPKMGIDWTGDATDGLETDQ